MRTTNKEFKAQVQGHIINEVLDEEYGTTTAEQLQAVIDGFTKWYGKFERKAYPSVYDGFKNWMLALPSQVNIEFEDYKIHETLKGWFEACGEPYKEMAKNEDLATERERNTYYHLVTREFDTLCKKHGVKELLYAI